jgi:mycothiol synthase
MSLVSHLKRTTLASYARRALHRFLRRTPPAPLLRMIRRLHKGELLEPARVPGPFRLALYAPGDEQAWIGLLNASGEFGAWGPSRLSAEILSTLLPDGGVFAVHGGRLIGCASACCMEQYRPWAILMYVVVLPEYRGRGLGQALVWETLRVCQRCGFPGMLLHTEAHRLAAVRSYFKLGFLPQLEAGAAGERQWEVVLRRAFLRAGE